MHSTPDVNVPVELAQAYQNLSVAVFGATGFIGQWVARWLCQANARLHLFVRNPAAAKSEFKRFSIHGDLVPWHADRLGEARREVARIKPAVIFNLAGYGVRRDERDERLSRLVNRDVVEALADAQASTSASWPGLRFVHAGSALEYGRAAGNLDEIKTTPQPTTVYGINKLEGTNILSRFVEGGFPAVTARLFTVYGPGEPPGRLLPSLLEATKSSEAIPLTAGRQRRDFTYVEEVVEGLLRLGTCGSTPSPVINVATGQLTPVREFILTTARLAGIEQDRLSFDALPTRPEEMNHSDVSIDRLRSTTRWEPTMSTDQGIRRTLAYTRVAPVC